ncbi:MAG: isocitrate/isopropylmalate family dehydrogenase [Ruoffia tabacinasalis]|nr:isocitrate/isopropylmalate family dehydrogenase [Ruoffia tabacinasalis]
MKITLIPGDGIGPEITESTRNIVDALDIGIEWEVVAAVKLSLINKVH